MSYRTAGAKGRRLLLMCGVIPAAVTVAVALYRPTFLTRLDSAVYDALLRSTRPRPPSNRVVIVDVDERSLSVIGQWPWPRDVIGHLIARLRGLGASTIALDVIFAEPDRHEPMERAEHASGRDPLILPDDALREALRGGRVVLGYAMTFDTGPRGERPCVLHPVPLVTIEPREETEDAPFFRATGAVCNLPALAQAAGVSGFLNAAPDSDGILRRVPLLVELDGAVYPGLALAAVAGTTGAHDLALRISNVNSASLIFDNRDVPLDGKSNLLLRYRGKKRTFPYVSAADVLSGVVSERTIQGKIVFVGTTALGTREVVATPLDTLFAGVEVQATVADNLLQQDFIRRSQWGTTLESVEALVLGVAIAVLVTTTGLLSAALAGVGAVAALWGADGWLLSIEGIFVSPVIPTFALISGLVPMTVAKFTVERRRADSAARDKTTAQQLMIKTLLSLTEARDAETGRHSRRTQQYARLLADRLATHPDYHDYLTPERIDLLSNLAPIHDIGKVAVPDRILNKPGPLTPAELAEMRKHPVFGLEVILRAEREVGVRDDAILAMAKDIVYTHHERWDGTGYPRGMRGREIPIVGRVLAIVDVYDAAVTRTLYGPARSHDDAVAFIVNGKGTHFDPAVVEAFVSVATAFEDVSRREVADGQDRFPS